MGNMSYCRFENTFNDLDDCNTALGEKTFDELSDTEKKYAQLLIRMCRNIADDFMDEVEDIELSKNSQVPQCVQTSVSGSVLSTETRYYLFENNSTNETEINFISQILLFSEKVQKFNCGLGEFILGITSKFDDSCESENADVLDIIFNFRKQITKKKKYNRKPNPQRYWKGEWEVLVNENFI